VSNPKLPRRARRAIRWASAWGNTASNVDRNRSAALNEQWEQVYSDIEDLLVPSLQLDVWERALYYHLLRHTRLKGEPSGTFGVAPLSRAMGISDWKAREVLRSLHRKGCAKIEDRSRSGHLVTVLLPAEIPNLQKSAAEAATVDIESLDFFFERLYVCVLLARENNRCFYCLKHLTEATCELDHLIPQAATLDNSYRNIVAACYGCNKSKGELSATDFVRKLYREGVLNETELQERLATTIVVQSGQSVPDVSSA
jgi:hypothetical protein